MSFFAFLMHSMNDISLINLMFRLIQSNKALLLFSIIYIAALMTIGWFFLRSALFSALKKHEKWKREVNKLGSENK